MNSEELEQSLRTEFEGYLKSVLADMKQEVSQFQQKFETEFEKHKSHLDEVFQEFSERIQMDQKFDEGFRETVVEHLRLARDEGARITATAMADAEELKKASEAEKKIEVVAPPIELSSIRDAINDISCQNSQSAILKSLISHAAQFTPRGAFFVVKNQHFVGWRVFGKQENLEDNAITEIIFPISASSILGESVRSLSVIESQFGTFNNDADYLSRLEFGQPEKMYAIPLIARGRGVAAIYADNGDGDEKVNIEALETLVSVAGLTVELLAAAQGSNYVREPVKTTSYLAPTPATETREEIQEATVSTVSDYQQESVEEVETKSAEQSDEFVTEQVKEIQKTTSFYYQEPEISDAAEKESEETFVTSQYDVQEVEVEESFEKATYEEPAEVEAAPVYEVSDEFESSDVNEFNNSETEDLPAPKIVSVENYNFSSEEPEKIEQVEQNDAVYDDDLIEEIQAQPETSATQEEIDSVYKETFVPETQSEEVEEETSEPINIPKPTWNAPTESVEKVSESYSLETNSQSEPDIYDPAVETFNTIEPTDEIDDFSKTSTFNYAEFETNQDFNSSPVQFEEPVETAETVETPSFEYSTPITEETPQIREVEEVSFSESQPIEVIERTVPEPEIAFEEPEAVAPPVAVAAPVRTRFSERNVDLPIEVGEEERRLHNDARRFARLLISEIKLYNEQKVKEGREANDLYDRLREAIDRSREMYDKRVQPVVVQRFDYFHYEVVNTLAEGEESKLGTTYPGVTV